MQPLIKIENLTVAYDGKTALQDASLVVEQNDFLGVIGFLFCRSFAFGSTCDIGKHQCSNGYMYYVASHSPAYSLVASKQGHALGAKSRWPYMRALG